MDKQTQAALFLARTPVHRLLRRLHHKLDRYMEIAENWNNGDETTNGEAWLIGCVGRHLRVAFDVGANVGRWTLLLHQGNPECVVYAFEPSPQTFASLQKQVEKLVSVRPFQLGLADRATTLSFHDYGPDSVLSSFISREKSVDLKPQRDIQVPVSTIDAFRSEHSLDAIDFIKIDTEGYEMAVLRGAADSLRKRRIAMIQFEYGGTWLDARESLAEANDLLKQHGYELYRLRQQSLTKIIYDSRRHECFKYSNFVAVCSPDILRRWQVPVSKE